jgi:hypothetical protein
MPVFFIFSYLKAQHNEDDGDDENDLLFPRACKKIRSSE